MLVVQYTEATGGLQEDHHGMLLASVHASAGHLHLQHLAPDLRSTSQGRARCPAPGGVLGRQEQDSELERQVF